MEISVQSLADGFRLLLPLLFGEILEYFCHRQVYRAPLVPVGAYSQEKTFVAHLMSVIRLPGRGTAVCCLGAALCVTVGIGGIRLFPSSVFLQVSDNQPFILFLWGVLVMALVWHCTAVNRALFLKEHEEKCQAILHPDRRQDWEDVAGRLNTADAGARWGRARALAVGWIVIYLALLAALLPAQLSV